MAMRMTNADPMAFPAIVPALNFSESCEVELFDGSMAWAGADVEAGVVGQADVGGAVELATAEEPLDDNPPGCKFAYASQSGFRAARGHVGSWQSDKSCDP